MSINNFECSLQKRKLYFLHILGNAAVRENRRVKISNLYLQFLEIVPTDYYENYSIWTRFSRFLLTKTWTNFIPILMLERGIQTNPILKENCSNYILELK